MASGRLTRAEFEGVVEEALASLPKRFADLVENVIVSVEDEPTGEDLDVEGDAEAIRSCWASTAASRSPTARTTRRCCPTKSPSSAGRSAASPARATRRSTRCARP